MLHADWSHAEQADGQPMEQHQTLPLPGQQQASIKAEPHITAKAEGPQQVQSSITASHQHW